MKLLVAWAGLLALLHSAAVWPQAAHSLHGKPATKAEEKPPAKADARPVAAPQPAAPTRDSASYRSPFTGYRPFAPDEPMKQWRAANDEVRESGGHVGLMKGKQ